MMEHKRLLSLDVLRGFDMFWIMGGGAMAVAVAGLIGSDTLAEQMGHVAWNGFRFYDLIFPLFLFISGVSFPFSVAKSRRGIYAKIAKRVFLLVLFGVIYNGLLELNGGSVRLFSVLGRIGLAWGLAAVLYLNTGRVGRLVWCGAILVGYWLLLWGLGDFSYEGNLVGVVDRALFGAHLHVPHVFDPEGLLSTVPAVATALLGMWAGDLVRDNQHVVRTLLCIGVLLLALAGGWHVAMPINKSLWSSSFVCLTGGFSFLLFALFYWVIDVKGWSGWTLFFRVIGLNSITIYMVQRMVNLDYTSRFLTGGLVELLPEAWGALVGSAAYAGVCWLVLWGLYRYKIFLKI